MWKTILRIAINNIKKEGLQVVINILMEFLLEIQREKQRGEFDTSVMRQKSNQYEQFKESNNHG